MHLINYPEVSIRMATEVDALTVFKWRNSPELIEMSANKKRVSLNEHKIWFKKKLMSEDLMMIIQVNRVDAGLIRFERRTGGECEVSIYLAPGNEGRGVGTLALQQAIECAAFTCSGFVAMIRKENKVSIMLFERQGFVRSSATNGDIIEYRK